MTLRRTLGALLQAILDEADRNADFRSRLERALGVDRSSSAASPRGIAEVRRRGGRRAPAILDPVELAHQGEGALRAGLASLDIEKLRDIVAQHGMDPGKLVMKWKDTGRVVDRIVEISLRRATKGDVFRND